MSKEIRYYIYNSDSQKKEGPFYQEEIKKALALEKIDYKTMIWKSDEDRWLNVGDLKEFSKRVSVRPPKFPPLPADALKEDGGPSYLPSNDDGPKPQALPFDDGPKEWYLYDHSKEQHGPYSHAEVINLLVNKAIRKTAYAWKKPMRKWRELINLKDFKNHFKNGSPQSPEPTLLSRNYYTNFHLFAASATIAFTIWLITLINHRFAIAGPSAIIMAISSLWILCTFIFSLVLNLRRPIDAWIMGLIMSILINSLLIIYSIVF